MAVAAVSSSAYDLAGFSAAIDGIRVIDNPALVRLTSRDFFWYSPVLKDALNQKYADLVVCPCDEAEIIRVVRAAARFRVPITPRGGGTGNYGQAVPLAGGIVLDMTGLDAIEWARPGQIRVQAGRKLAGIDGALRGDGWELRMFPSTKPHRDDRRLRRRRLRRRRVGHLWRSARTRQRARRPRRDRRGRALRARTAR